MADDFEWVERDDLIVRVSAAVSLPVPVVTEIVDVLDGCVTDAIDGNDTVDYPGLGLLDGRDDHTAERRTVRLLDLVPRLPGVAGRACRWCVGSVGARLDHRSGGQCGRHRASARCRSVSDNPDAVAVLDAVERRGFIDHLRGLRRRVWLVQVNPDKFDVVASIAKEGLLPDTWSVGRYLDRIQPGDVVVFWVSGRDAGVYAIGEVCSVPFDGTVNPEHAIDPNPGWRHFIEIDLYLDLFDGPVLRSDLMTDPRFAGQSIIRVPRAANPHGLDRDALEAILDRLD